MTEVLGRAVVRGSGLSVVLLACVAALAPSAFALPPANDGFAVSELVSGASVTATGTNAEATKETGEPNHAGYTGGASVWYRWTAPETGTVVVDTQGSDFDTLLAVYTGDSVGGLHLIDSNDQWYGNQSRVKIPVTAGQEYRIAVDGYYGSQGSITLHVFSAVAPANDDLVNAAPLTGSSATATGSNVGATREPGEPSPYYYGTASVWWTWTAPSTGGVTISTAGSGFNTTLAVYTGSTVSGLIVVGSNDDSGVGVHSHVTFRAIEGTTYRIAVDGGYYSSEGSIALELNQSPPPANDAFAAATPLAGDAEVIATGSNLGASVEPGEPSHYSWETTTSATVWYAWTAPSDGSLTLRADASFSTALAVYTGTQVSELTRVTNQAQDYWGGPEQIRVRVEAGVTYYIALDGRHSGSGTFNLTLNLVGRPGNDDFDDADTLVGLHDTASGTNVGATQEPGEPIHEENYYDPSVWYQWTAPSDGGVTIDTAGSTFNTVVAVYTGDTVSTLTRVATTRIGNTGPERRNFRAAAGVTYRIAIDGRGAQQGTYELELTEILPPANDMFVDGLSVSAGDGMVEGDYIGATGENGEPGSGGTAGATVWYRYTALETGRARLAITANDAFPIEVGVYTGPTVDALTAVTSSNGSPIVSWRATAGETYNIQIGGGARPSRGTFAFTLVQVPPPPNDDFADAAVLEGASDSDSGDNTAATKEPSEPSHYGYGTRSIWWEWTAPDDGRATIDVSASFEWVAAVYTGSSLDSLTRLRSVDYGPITFMASAGTTYRIVVDSYYDDYYSYSYGSGPVNVALSLVDTPPNDYFVDATVLSGSSDAVTGSNVGASVDSYWEPAHAGYTAEHSVWYRWQAPATGQVTIDTAGSSFDTRMAVYTGSYNDYYYLTTIASNDDAGGTPQAAVSFMAQGGEVYRIAVDGKAGATGSIALALEHGAPPANDEFASAQELSGSAADVSGSNVFATSEAGEPDHAGNEGGASVWYRWTAPEDGTLSVSTAGSSFDTLLAVYTGSAVDGLTAVAANDNAPDSTASALETPVTAGTTYSIAVDGWNNRHVAGQGSIHLVLELGPPAAQAGTGASEDEPVDPPAPPADEPTDPPGDEPTDPPGDEPTDPPADQDPDPPVDQDTDPPAGTTEPSTTTRAPSTTTAMTTPATRPAPAPAPVPVAPTPQPAAPAPLTVSATIPSQRIASVLRSGLAGTAVCSVACSVEVAVTLPKGKAKARAARASKRAAATTGAAGRPATPFTAKLNAATRQVLRRAKSLTLTVTVTARSGSATATATRRVTLRR